jgi:hypothetical protein
LRLNRKQVLLFPEFVLAMLLIVKVLLYIFRLLSVYSLELVLEYQHDTIRGIGIIPYHLFTKSSSRNVNHPYLY